MYFVVKKRTDGRDSEKPQYVTFTGNKDVQKYFNQDCKCLHVVKKVRTFPDYFANYEQFTLKILIDQWLTLQSQR